MKRYQPAPGLSIPCVAMGCMRIAGMEVGALETLVQTALEGGMDFFDHADFYGDHQSEARFGEMLQANPSLRGRMLIQSKCGIRAGFYDSSYEHIVNSAENSLRKLHTDHLDALLIHRPDVLAEPEEIARAFRSLKEAGKVRYFGVSNHSPMQVEALQQAVGDRLLFNQMQLSIVHTGMIDQGINVNTTFPGSVDRDGGVLEYMKLKKMVLQVWSPFQHGFIEGVFLDNPAFPEVNRILDEMAEKYGVSKTALTVAWLLRLPMMVQVICGTTSPARVKQILSAAEVTLSREDWYAIYRAAGNRLP
ncbi:MAG: aldo/keto reductase [Clostridiales bacterium]|nr:aldo/keto reductase [Clostridiales bacterium]MDO4350924.1 aldo/keto reductase [Eubacteriales bacterium]MDY4009596.1 aldo/keto reductase [Candidatus Limiplasma sp.]